MTLDELLASLFPQGHTVSLKRGLVSGCAQRKNGLPLAVLGVTQGTELGVEQALWLAGKVMEIIREGSNTPILVLLDSGSQRMSKRDELLGLNEFLAHLAKCLIHAQTKGHPTLGILYGKASAGAFLATGLATQLLLALPGAYPAVMDLSSMSRVTKLPLDFLQEQAESTPVFAPGLDNFRRTGAIDQELDPAQPLAAQLEAILDAWPAQLQDVRDIRGYEQGGRPMAAEIARRVQALAMQTAG